MKSRAAKKPAADEDEVKSKKIRSSRGKRPHRSRSPSGSGSDSPPRKRSKKPIKKIADRKSKKSKGSSASRRRRRHRSPSRSPSSGSSSVSRGRSRHSSGASERSVSPPPRSCSRDTRKRKGRGRDRDREKDRKRTRTRRSRSYLSASASSGSSRSRSRSRSKGKGKKQRAGGTRDDASRDEIVRDYDNCHAYRTEKNSAEDVDRDEEAVAVAKKGTIDVDEYESNVGLGKMESPPSEDSNEAGEILPSKDANESDEILPAGSGSPEAQEDLELILRQKALENFRKFRGAAVMASKADINGSGKEALTDSPQNTVTKIAEARPAVTPFQKQGTSIEVSHPAGSPGLEDLGNGTSPWKQEENIRGDRSPGALLASDTSTPTQQQGSRVDAIRSTYISQGRKNGGSVMQRLGTPGSSASVKQRLGSSEGVSATPRVRSVVTIPAREGFGGSTFTMSPTVCEDPAPVESSSEVRHLSVNKLEGTNGDGRNTSEASAPENSVLSTDEGRNQTGTEDKDGSQFEKRTFSRMHDGETVQVSYKVYIPTKSPRLARKLQR